LRTESLEDNGYFPMPSGDDAMVRTFSESSNSRARSVNFIEQANRRNITELPGCTVTAYAASLFQRVRLQDGINFQRLFMSLDYKKNREQIFSSGEASGASGSFFFFSHDRRFIVKTMS